MSVIPPYTYTKLDRAKQEIRLLTLLPSQSLVEPVRITISHVPFTVNEKDTRSNPKIKDLEEKLLPGWHVYETLEGRLLFRYYDHRQEKWTSTWICPDVQREFVPDPYDTLNKAREPEFEALSYTWGSNAKSESAYIFNDTEVPSHYIITEATPCLRLDITENLADALRHVRYVDRCRILWVDAISINQDDITERSEQVLRMKDLYKHVDRVLVWLGPSSKDSFLALSTLEYIGKQVEISLDMRWSPSPEAIEPMWCLPDHALAYDAQVWNSINDLLTRPWFNRLWVTQEIHLANSQAVIQCGNENVLWRFLRRGILCLHSKIYGIPGHLSDRLRIITHLCYPSLGLPLPDLLERYHHRGCVDPRDKVYGLLGLASFSSTRNITPDYSLSIMDAYKSVFLGYTSQSRRLDLLDLARPSDDPREWLSWVPDWSVDFEVEDYLSLAFCASGDSSACWNYSIPSMLRVVGVHIGTIIQRLVVAGRISELLSNFRVEDMNLRYPTGENVLHVYARVRHLNLLKETTYGVSNEITLKEAQRLLLENSSDSLTNIYFARYLQDTSKRWIIQTSEGYIGMAPRNSKISKLAKYLGLVENWNFTLKLI